MSEQTTIPDDSPEIISDPDQVAAIAKVLLKAIEGTPAEAALKTILQESVRQGHARSVAASVGISAA